MTEITLIRHAQASFGTDDYDRLSPLGHEQSEALGRALARQGLAPVRLFTGTQRRHRETLAGLAGPLGLDAEAATVHPGLDEFDFRGLLDARFQAETPPAGLHSDRRTHFRTLRDTVLAWQRDAIDDPPERWADFAARVEAAREALRTAEGPVLAVSSGGPISRLIAEVMEAPTAQMIRLQLQMKNCAVSRLIAGRTSLHLHGFNETPHIDAATAARLLTYS